MKCNKYWQPKTQAEWPKLLGPSTRHIIFQGLSGEIVLVGNKGMVHKPVDRLTTE